MDEARYRLRDFEDRDYPAEARVATQGNPQRPSSPDALREWDAWLRKPPFVQVKQVVEDRSRGEAVGFGLLFTPPWTFDPRKFWVGAAVDQVHAGRGIGSAIARAILAEASRRQAVTLWASARADQEPWIRFMTRWGFHERRRTWQSRLEVAAAADFPDRTEQLARDGITVTTLAEEGPDREEVRRRLYDLSLEVGGDVPRMGPYTPVTFPRFVEVEITRPEALPTAYFLARRGERYIAVSNLARIAGDPTGLDQEFTAVRKELRGRGVASELKRRTVEYAREHGFRYIQTFNDSLNLPMWAINEKLGYRKEVAWVHSQRDMAMDTSPSVPG
ncbi:MAG TPA: GNAT family N-acetyltransferase [Thermoplasmata archaeon]|nr:GNAT family N-acetyltransferase [Thermoplasmata archaeon]